MGFWALNSFERKFGQEGEAAGVLRAIPSGAVRGALVAVGSPTSKGRVDRLSSKWELGWTCAELCPF